jgi:hypothetical protein
MTVPNFCASGDAETPVTRPVGTAGSTRVEDAMSFEPR